MTDFRQSEQTWHNPDLVQPPTGQLLERVLQHPDVGARRTIYERYDSVVRGATSIPCGYADAGVVVPVPGAPLAVSLGIGGNPRHATIDPKRAAELAVCEAIRNVVCVGARPTALTDCLNFGNPEDPVQMGEFVAAVDGIAEAARELGLPFVSGNVSFYNQSASGRAIPASPIVACVGTLLDVSKSVTPRFKKPGSTLFLIGEVQNALGGSIVAETLGIEDRRLPQPRYAQMRLDLAFILAAFERGLIASAHDVSDGGLLVAVAEMTFATLADRPIGAHVDYPPSWSMDTVGEDESYFGEAGAFIVEATDPEALFSLAGYPATNLTDWSGITVQQIGKTIDEPRLIAYGCGERPGEGEPCDLYRLYDAWSSPLRDFYEGVPT